MIVRFLGCICALFLLLSFSSICHQERTPSTYVQLAKHKKSKKRKKNTPQQPISTGQRDWEPEAFEILNPTERKPAHTAVLIVIQPDEVINLNNYTNCRWLLAKKVWEQYMNSHPNIDCYFVQHTNLREGSSEQTWIEGNVIYVGVGSDSCENGGIPVSKTVAAIEKLLPEYTHFFRTNVSAFVNLNALNEYAETHHQSMFTGPLWEQCWWLLGYGMLFSADVALHIVKEYERLKDHCVVTIAPEDLVLTALATGICPFYGRIEHPGEPPDFTCYPTLPLGVHQLMCRGSFSVTQTTRLSHYGLLLVPAPSFEQAIYYCNLALNNAILYRIRSGFDLDKLAELYEYLLSNIYPGLSQFDLMEYAKSFPAIHDNNS
jgi:hypothetical protein